KTGGGGYPDEAAGLRWLGEVPGAPPVPGVVAVADTFLALEWVDSACLDEESFGRQLATLHRAGGGRFGALPPGGSDALAIGPVELPALESDSWAEVYADARLLPLARRARDKGALSGSGAAAVERVCSRLSDLSGPSDPPARVHGDLWGGNVLAGYLIDPAAHVGHREVDLAMLELFGGPGARFKDAYAEAYPLAEGHRERVGLWQLFPLLLHAVLFAGGYGARVEQVAARYS
ncbi:MAG: fructosamine kinase family protein, partial [Solirubrobacterales bacterium]|nr:fructosamine kinase family protein [Solirubrobacterales bacterium]